MPSSDGVRSPHSAAFDMSATCWAPSVRCHTSHESRVPKHRSWERSGSTASRIAATLVAERFGARRNPSAFSARHSPTVRRSCQPSAGATGRPVDRSHTTVDARWLEIPTASTGPWRSMTSRAHSIAESA